MKVEERDKKVFRPPQNVLLLATGSADNAGERLANLKCKAASERRAVLAKKKCGGGVGGRVSRVRAQRKGWGSWGTL